MKIHSGTKREREREGGRQRERERKGGRERGREESERTLNESRVLRTTYPHSLASARAIELLPQPGGPCEGIKPMCRSDR